MIHLSKTAATEVTRLKSKHPNPNALFRLGVESSGCSGLSYTMAFDDAPAPEDAVCESEGIEVAIDPQHLKYLNKEAAFGLFRRLDGRRFPISQSQCRPKL